MIHHAQNPTRRCAFSLIELLVVVTIITLLISILLPAIRRATFVSKVAACASNLRQVGVGLHAYASDNFTHYPHSVDPTPYISVPVYLDVTYRPAPKPWLISSRSHIDGKFDLVPLMKPYYGNDMAGVFTCPNIANEWNEQSKGRFPWWRTNAGTVSYGMMFNLFRSNIIDRPMRRVGERWRQAVSGVTQLGTRGQYFDILAMDPASRHVFGPQQRGNHPSYGAGGEFISIPNGHGTGMLTNGTLNANYLTEGGGVRNYDGIDYRNTAEWGGAASFFLVPAALAKGTRD